MRPWLLALALIGCAQAPGGGTDAGPEDGGDVADGSVTCTPPELLLANGRCAVGDLSCPSHWRYVDGGACARVEQPSDCGCVDTPCRLVSCVEGRCYERDDFDGNGCRDGTSDGICHAGGCCTGCWDGSSCRTGHELAVCGSHGQTCAHCPPDGDTHCFVFACDEGFCSSEPINGTGCPHCGARDEPCCAGTMCEGGLVCGPTPCKDCFEPSCQPP